MSAPPSSGSLLKRRREDSALNTGYEDLPFEMAPPSRRPLPDCLHKLDGDCARELQKTVSFMIRKHSGQIDRFPGPLPATVGRAQLADITSEKFWVTEKSDGERKLLFADAHGVFLIDRKWTIEKVDAASFKQVFGTSGATLLDGELMTPPATQASYLAYDAVYVHGHDVSMYPFSERLRAITTICQSYTKLCEMEDAREHPFRIEQKFFVPQREIHRILSKISRHPQFGHRYVDIIRRRANKNDGLIFVADADSFRPQHSHSLLKWKWPDKNTIDFKIRHPFYDNNGQLELMAASYNKRDIIVRRMKVDLETRQKVQEWTKGRQQVVVECWYDSRRGTWKLCNPRLDKQHANFITTVISTMETMADNVTADELQRVCASYRAKE